MAKEQVMVIGLGRFGSAVARELERLGHQVLAIDQGEQQVNDISSDVTHALQLDAADEDALRSAGAGDFQTAIVAISTDAEASIFATMVLKRLGVRTVIAKAGSQLHGEILSRVGADRVVLPERETGLRLAHSFNVPNVIDYLDVAPNFGIEKIRPPASFIGKSLGELDLKTRIGLTPIALRRGQQVFVNPARDERVAEGDELILIGRDDKLDQLRGCRTSVVGGHSVTQGELAKLLGTGIGQSTRLVDEERAHLRRVGDEQGVPALVAVEHDPVVAVQADAPVRLELDDLGEDDLLAEEPVEEFRVQSVHHVAQLKRLVAAQP